VVSTRNAYHGHSEIRTRIPERLPAPDKPHCSQCGCVLRHDNHGTLCDPCRYGEIAIPDWALTLAAIADAPTLKLLGRIVKMQMDGQRPERYLLKLKEVKL